MMIFRNASATTSIKKSPIPAIKSAVPLLPAERPSKPRLRDSYTIPLSRFYSEPQPALPALVPPPATAAAISKFVRGHDRDGIKYYINKNVLGKLKMKLAKMTRSGSFDIEKVSIDTNILHPMKISLENLVDKFCDITVTVKPYEISFTFYSVHALSALLVALGGEFDLVHECFSIKKRKRGVASFSVDISHADSTQWKTFDMVIDSLKGDLSLGGNINIFLSGVEQGEGGSARVLLHI